MKYLIANFKQNGDKAFYADYAQHLKAHLVPNDKCRAIFCPPAPYLMFMSDCLRLHGVDADTCGQCISRFGSGAYTGGVSAAMVADCGAKYALVGHSEHHAASLKKITDKIKCSLQAKLKVILCVKDVNGLDAIPNGTRAEDIVIAYEPVEAIGTGVQPTTAKINQVVAELRAATASRLNGNPAVLYGGSVTSKNCKTLLKNCKIDGFIVGGASLNPANMVEIYNLVSTSK